MLCTMLSRIGVLAGAQTPGPGRAPLRPSVEVYNSYPRAGASAPAE